MSLILQFLYLVFIRQDLKTKLTEITSSFTVFTSYFSDNFKKAVCPSAKVFTFFILFAYLCDIFLEKSYKGPMSNDTNLWYGRYLHARKKVHQLLVGHGWSVYECRMNLLPPDWTWSDQNLKYIQNHCSVSHFVLHKFEFDEKYSIATK